MWLSTRGGRNELHACLAAFHARTLAVFDVSDSGRDMEGVPGWCSWMVCLDDVPGGCPKSMRAPFPRDAWDLKSFIAEMQVRGKR